MNMKTFGWITGILLIATVVVADEVFGPQTVEITSKRWVCTASRPVGIKAECTHFELKDLR